ncbi:MULTISPECIES: phospho-N-acetylmuramoyl-pentapeptide-transferase [unclassified Granulicatella]|uniref:phospho-N-acetylmuramoyl-pentapeptide- transferase n=1 Tax=unclassified Granulicatella TaxID=2630493 RepID=UPI0010731612|nr:MULTISPECIES: phospho-N-acetylmuramoyl-pentapeptide-transferase [unclassified Granulicatella]MBF0780157.1 phospho-N-acetylmuramoyl-pentapeptide-transferase [Granulicatella sp. 19428wC4_WM01]TFU95761.1 phospho-N-acetylmuramoyl-pentapeptide-transferase [Granulicatella sp. WM01]
MNQFIFFEMFITFCASFTLTIVIMPFFIIYFTQKKMGQVTREEGPKWHETKTGTPTMGGIAFVIAAVITFLVIAILNQFVNATFFSILFVLISFATIGFLDDYLKLIRQQNEGLTSKQKFICQLIFSLGYVGIVFLSGMPTSIHLPFVGEINHVFTYLIFSTIWLTGFSNAVNLTDGLDGLVAGTASVAFGAYAIIAYTQKNSEILLFCLAIMGGLIGFFLFNKKPAKIFMGDVGSLALGAVLASISILLKVEWSLLIIGSVFVIETASVMLQVGSYKLRKKRIFKMSPIHHHFELSGWSEWKVVSVFWLIGLSSACIYLWLF